MNMQINNTSHESGICDLQRIFLLSHMRANTSLISHILGSHPAISGYYEMHLSYLTENDLDIQKKLYARKDVIKSSSQYLFDKLLHNKYELLLENLDMKRIKVLVSIRSPEQTIKSIINLFANKKTEHPYAQPELATDYYINRITKLAQFCAANPGDYYYYDADLIRLNPQKSLRCIQQWLSLTTPLTEQYQMFSQTGQARAGDSSANMRKGTIVKQQSNYEGIAISSTLLNKAETQTRQQKQFIIEHAIESAT